MATINENDVRTWFEVFHGEPSDTVEIRVLDGKNNSSGYFRDVESTINAIKSVTSGAIYSPINEINEACFSRSQCNRLQLHAKATTSDNDITGRRWILIDFDPKRSSDTNATDEEKSIAFAVMKTVGLFLQQQGFESPVIADSGNGYHLYYRICMANEPHITELIHNFLKVLDMYFGSDSVDIDNAVFNASRISKVIGTMSNKGTSTTERPQRLSKFIKVPAEIKVNDIAYVKKVADMYPKPEPLTRSNNFNARFDLEQFITKHGIRITKRSRFKDGEKLILEHCPFDENHKSPDAAIFAMNDGSFGFKCLHNSCANRTWKDFRLFYDPHAYDERSYKEFRSRLSYDNPRKEFTPVEETEEKGKKWLEMRDIGWVDMSKIVTLPTGYIALDKRIKGLMVGDITVLSGLSGAGKTSWLDCVILNVIDKGFKVAVWSGELQGFRFQSWIDQIAAGKTRVQPYAGYDNMYYTPKPVAEKIHTWLADKLLLYNNDYGYKWQQIFSDINDVVDKGCQLIILDNLAALDINSDEISKNEQQTKFITDIKEFAKKRNVHVIVVCHPRKEMQFLRKESISGTADLTNLADNVLILHRVGKDFQDRAGIFFGADKVEKYMDYSCVIEVAKNRAFGVVDFLCGMYYEQESRRLKNEVAENYNYGWEDKGEQLTFIPDSEDEFWKATLKPNSNAVDPF